jgi:SAM-dependent methyltransferase
MLRCASNLGLDPTGLEFSPEAAAVAQKFAPAAVVFIGSLNELPFESANFKYLTCLGAPANLVDPRLDLAEIFRVIKPGGRACLVLNLEPSAEAGEEYLVIEPASLPAATTFSGWAEQLSAVGFNLLDAWPEPFLWSPRGFPRWGGGAGGRWLKRRFWEWLPDWRRLPIVFLAEKPRTLNRATVI